MLATMPISVGSRNFCNTKQSCHRMFSQLLPKKFYDFCGNIDLNHRIKNKCIHSNAIMTIKKQFSNTSIRNTSRCNDHKKLLSNIVISFATEVRNNYFITFCTEENSCLHKKNKTKIKFEMVSRKMRNILVGFSLRNSIA